VQITRITTEVFDFDVEAEQKRLKSCFKGAQLKRQEAILNAFLEGEVEKLKKLYDKLPRCKELECSEAEYVGEWISVFTGSDWGLKPEKKEVFIERFW